MNQTYWHARSVYDDLLAEGAKLRAAQVGALKGRATDIRGAADRHAAALSRIVATATGFGETAGIPPQPDALRRMFEAVSTREALPAPHGRFVKPLEPAGFEALAGIAIAPPPRPAHPEPERPTRSRSAGAGARPAGSSREDERRRQEEDARRSAEDARQRERLAADRRRQAAIRTAEKRAAQAVEAERRARAAWERARRDLEEADRALAHLLAGDS